MNQREKIILIVTLTVVCGALAFNFLGDSLPGFGAGDEGGIGDVANERRRFKNNLETLRRSDDINDQYKAIEVGLKEGEPGTWPERAFSNELFDLLTERLKVQNPRIEPASFSAIPNIDDYCYVDIPLQIQGDFNEIMRLLRDMEQLGLLIKSFRINQRNRNQNDIVDLNLTVARLVKTDKRLKRLIARSSGRKG